MKHDQRIDRYILGKMSEEEASEFEAYFLSNQACLDQLELTERLYEGLKKVSATPIDNVVDISSQKTKWWQIKVPLIPIAAAMLLFIVSPFGIYQQTAQVDRSSALKSQQVEVVNIEMSGLRGDAEKVIELPRTSHQLLISIYIDTDVPAYQFQSFAFELLTNNGDLVFSQEQLKPNLSSTIYVNLGNLKFEANTYQYRIVGMDNQNHSAAINTGRLKFL